METFARFLLILVFLLGAKIPEQSASSLRIPLQYEKVVFPDERIINGQPATPGQIPWQVALQIYKPQGIFYCGGSIISKTAILTAAHCTVDATSIRVHAGTLQSTGIGGQSVTVKQIHVHPQFDGSTLANNIAVLTLPYELTLGDTIQIITLDEVSNCSRHYAGRLMEISGWGKTSDSSTIISHILNYANVTAVNTSVCDTFYDTYVVDEKNICVQQPADDTIGTACTGDSGGPLYDFSTQKQVGIASFFPSSGCAKGPTGFTCVGPYLQFISNVTGTPKSH